MSLKNWDIPTRATHWSLALCVVLNFFIIEEGSDLHDYVGYLASGLVVFRIGWSFFGSGFTHHNRLASFVYFLIWSLVIALGISGWMMSLDQFWGEEWLEDIHENLSTALQILIVTHLAGVALDSIRYRRPTWKSMITGVRTGEKPK